MGTKNNPANRGEAGKGKVYEGKPVKPVLYIGKHVGNGTYMAAGDESGNLITDKQGKPLPWDAIASA